MGVFDEANAGATEAESERERSTQGAGETGHHVGSGGVGSPPEAQAAAGPTEASQAGLGTAPAAGRSGPGAAEDRAGLGMEVTEGEGLGSSGVSGEDLGGFDIGAARLDDTSGADAPTSDVTGGPAGGTTTAGGDGGRGGDSMPGGDPLPGVAGGGEGDVPEPMRAGVAAGARSGLAGAEDVAGVDEGPARIPTDTSAGDGSSYDPTGAVSDAAESGQDNGMNA